nr:MAG: ORF1 [TTV-like mini virus]
MPRYYRFYKRRRWNYYRPKRWTRRRPRFWRPKRFIRWRRPLFRKRLRVRKRLNRKKKLKYLYLKEFQPRKINKCKIKGIITTFQCGPHRIHREWTNYMTSFYPPVNEGGGGWSQIKFSLEGLYEQHELLHCKWTKSNVLMPLCRYTGCKLKLYRTNNVDYITHYTICYPMLVTKYQHTNAQPSLMLKYSKHIIVPSLKRKPHGKLYIKKKIRPPEMFQSKWYFQVDIYKQPLLLVTTTAMDLDRWSLNPSAVSNNISILTLNTDFFQNHNFIQYGLGTGWWQVKPNYYLYGTLNGSYETSKVADLIFLGQTRNYTTGNPIGADTTWENYSMKTKQRENFGNPFHSNYLHKDIGLYISQTPPNTIFQMTYRQKKLNEVKVPPDTGQQALAPVTQDLFTEVRYNPERDKGDNKIWLVKNSDIIYGWHEPQEEDLKYEGFPLWALLWGYIDWHHKYKKYPKIEEDYTLVIQTKNTFPIYDTLVPINKTFTDGYSPWQSQTKYRTPTDAQEWHPKVKFQERQIENICETGPGTVKTATQSIEAHMEYCFYFKWGGCPNDLENITDPADQPHFPVPNNELEGPEIQDPNYNYTTDIWPWDIRRQIITKRAAQRIKDSKETEISYFTGSKMGATTAIETTQTIPTQISTQTSEEEETTPNQQQLIQLKRTNNNLRQQLTNILSQTVNLRY